MKLRGSFFVLAVAVGTSVAGAAPAHAQNTQIAPKAASPAAPAPAVARRISPAAQTGRTLARINADAAAILNALQWDPTLGAQLAKNPTAATSLLKARGAIRSEKIVVEKSASAQESITISLYIGNVKTVFTLPT